MKVIFILGSKVDIPWAKKIRLELRKWKISSKIHVASAHKVPELVFKMIQEYNEQKQIIYVTIAGRSNALSGVVSANAVHPVIACPPFKDKSDMMLNIHSTLQMPSETPVLTVLDPQNVAGACARMFGLGSLQMQKQVAKHIKNVKKKFKK